MYNWENELRNWLQKKTDCPIQSQDHIVNGFQKSFNSIPFPDYAWFGCHKQAVSLVSGGVFLTAIIRDNRGNDQGTWLIIDEKIQQYKFSCLRVKAITETNRSFYWAHTLLYDKLFSLEQKIADNLWQSHYRAINRLFTLQRTKGFIEINKKRGKLRLSEFDYRDTSTLDYLSFPDEIEETVYVEGAVRKVIVNAYERDPNARRKCIEHYGNRCYICDFSFKDQFGDQATSGIHVHHENPIAMIKKEYIIDPINEMKPVCPNCHAFIHSKKPPFTVHEVIDILKGKAN